MVDIGLLSNDISTLNGAGQFISKALKKLCGSRLIDLLLYLPKSYNKRKLIKSLKDAIEDQTVILKCKIVSYEFKTSGLSKIIAEFDGVDSIEIVYFKANKQYLENVYKIGETRFISGKINKSGFKWQIIHPDYVARDNQIQQIPELEPIYGLTKGLSNKMIANFVNQIFAQITSTKYAIPEWLDVELIKEKNWPSFLEALKIIHKPNQIESKELIKARERLTFDELFANQIGLKLLKISYKSYKGRIVNGDGSIRNQIINGLDFELTKDQKIALKEIYEDQKSKLKMIRMIQGDVGSGKTIVALLAMANSIECGLQAILMVPTEILAQQHFESIAKILSKANLEIKIGLLTSSSKKKNKLIGDIKNNQYQIIIGTHALFQEKVQFSEVGLIVIDEQHRFGVNHRMMLSSKDNAADLLFMSATPIPRSLSMIQYGYMDNSLIVEKPKNRLPIQTSIVSSNQLIDVVNKVNEFIAKGEKIYWICPLIEESLKLEYAAIEKRAILLKQHFNENLAIIHGRMKDKEIDLVMKMFSGKQFDKSLILEKSEHKNPIDEINYHGVENKNVLLSTTLVEVGVNVPEATLIVIEDAQKFGLSQLHQLRGRVGRSNIQSYCILIYNSQNITRTGRARLQALKESNDGFYIAEQDLKIRGGGELSGTKQSGYYTYRVANVIEDIDALREASSVANTIVKKSSTFSSLPDAIKFAMTIFNVNDSDQTVV
jgi:ATP-dependent DNA helicase RecG